MPKRYPPEVKRDVVAVNRTSGLTDAQIAEDCGMSEPRCNVGSSRPMLTTVSFEGTTTSEQDELAALKRRSRVLEQDVEIRFFVEQPRTSGWTRSQSEALLKRRCG
jgi:transposase